MKQTVLNRSLNQNLFAKTGFGNLSDRSGSIATRKFLLTMLGTFLAVAGMTQTYTATNQKGDAVINWEVASDKDLNYFVVQRSPDGEAFSNIATVFAGAFTNYSYKNKSVKPSTGVVYYRIVSVDETKETQSIAIKMIRLGGDNPMQALSLATFPNPVANDLRITLPATWFGKAVSFEVYTADGTMVKRTQADKAIQTEGLQLSGLPKGLYVVKAACGTENATHREKLNQPTLYRVNQALCLVFYYLTFFVLKTLRP